MDESISFLEAKKKKKIGSRGKPTEDLVQEILRRWKNADSDFDFDRQQDARAAGRPMPPTVADFTFCYRGKAGALEIKSTKHAFRLNYKDFPQFPRMRRRADAQGLCLLLIYHSQEKIWRLINVEDLPVITKGSWDLKAFPWFHGKDEVTFRLKEAIRDSVAVCDLDYTVKTS